MGRKKVRPVSESDFGLKIEEKNEVDGAEEKKYSAKKPDAIEKGKSAMKSDGNKTKGENIPNKKRKKKLTQKKGNLGSRNDGVGKEERAEKRDDEKAKTPAKKRKRGADEKMAEAFFSSPELPSSRLRARKQVPSFQKVFLGESDFDRIVGKRVKVFWSGSRRWFIGRVRSYDAKNNLHQILYDDGDNETLNLLEERFELEVMPDEVFSGSLKPEKETRSDGGEIDEGTVKDDAGEEKQGRSNKNLASKFVNKGKSKSKKPNENDTKKKVEIMDTDMEVDELPKKDEKALNEEFGRSPKPAKKKTDEDVGKDSAVDEKQAKMKKKIASKFPKKGGLKKVNGDDTEKENMGVDTEADVLPKKDEEMVLSKEFGLSPKPKKKEAGTAGEADEEVERQNVDEKKPTNTNRKVTFKFPRKGVSSQHNKNDAEKKAENLGKDMEVNALPKKDEKALSEELGQSSKLKKKETGSDGVEIDEKTEKENAGEKKRGRMKKKAALKVAKKGSSNQQSKNGAEKEGKTVGMSMEVDALSKEGEEKVLGEEFSQSPKPTKEETGSEEEAENVNVGERKQAKVNKKVALKGAKKGSSNQQNKNDTEEKVTNCGTDIEVDAPPKKDEEKTVECSRVEKVNGEIDAAPGDGDDSKSEIRIQVGKAEILDIEKRKTENGEVLEDKAEEKESGEKSISEGVDSTLGLQPTTDDQSEKDEGQRSLTSGSSSTESSDSQAPADEETKNDQDQVNVESVKNPVKTGKAKTKSKN